MVSQSIHQSITRPISLFFLTTAFVAHGMHDQPESSTQSKQKECNQLSRLDSFFHGLIASEAVEYNLHRPLSQHERNAVEELGRVILAAEVRLGVHHIFLKKEQEALDRIDISSERTREQAVKRWGRVCADIDRWHTEKAEVNKIDQKRLALLDSVLSDHPAIRELFQLDADHFPFDVDASVQQFGVLEDAGHRVQWLIAEDDKLKRAQVPAHKTPEATSQVEEKTAIASTIAQGGVLVAQRRRGSIV